MAEINSRSLISSNYRHSNDNLANAKEITGTDFSVLALNENATSEAEEAALANVADNSVWWSWTAPNNEPVEINTAGSNFATVLGVYRGNDYENLQPINSVAGDRSNLDRINFTPVAGETYQIAVSGASDRNSQIQLNFVNTASVSLRDDDLPQPNLTPVHRFYQYEMGYHFYTADQKENLSIKEHSAELQYNYEGESFAVLDSNLDSLTGEVVEQAQPVYRLFNSVTGSHLFTMDIREKDYILGNLDNYDFEGTAFYALAEATPELNTVPLYRLLNQSNGTHLFTSDRQELNYVRNNLDNFVSEGNDGVAFHVFEL